MCLLTWKLYRKNIYWSVMYILSQSERKSHWQSSTNEFIFPCYTRERPDVSIHLCQHALVFLLDIHLYKCTTAIQLEQYIHAQYLHYSCLCSLYISTQVFKTLNIQYISQNNAVVMQEVQEEHSCEYILCFFIIISHEIKAVMHVSDGNIIKLA